MNIIRYKLTLLVSLFLLTTHLYGNDIEALRQAILDEDLVNVKEIISKNPELVNATNGIYGSPLCMAVGQLDQIFKKSKQPFKIVKYLIEQGADCNSIDPQNRTPLLLAITANHTEAIIYLVNLSNRNVNLREEYKTSIYITESRSQSHWIIGNNPLEEAMWKCGLNIIEYLIKKGAQAHEDKISDGLNNSNSEVKKNAQFVLDFIEQKENYLANPLSSTPTLLPMILTHLVSLRTFKEKDFEWVVGQHYQASQTEKLKEIIRQQCDEDMRSEILAAVDIAQQFCVIRFRKLHDINFKFT